MKRHTVGIHDTRETLMDMGLSRTSAWRAIRRGWYTTDYHIKYQPGTNLTLWDTRQAYKAAWDVWNKRFRECQIDRWDLVQASVLRMLELSGKSVDFSFQWKVALNTMRDYLDANR
jgi:hypothetical protein